MNELVDKIYETCKNHQDLLNEKDSDIIKTMISDIVRRHRLKDKSDGPTREKIVKIFFGNMDFSRFSDIDMEDSVENILSVIQIWEQNKTA